MSNILIVGGSSGIGLATAEMLAKHQHHITIASRHAPTAKSVFFPKVTLDFTDEAAVEKFFKENTHFDYVIVTAMTTLSMGPLLSLDMADIKKSFDKVWGITHIIRYAAQYSTHLHAISVVSGAAADKRGAPITFLAMNGAATHVLVESLAIELAPLRINAISPGVTQTPLYGDTPRETLQTFVDGAPLKRVASPEEIAEVIVFVTLHPHMTGSIVTVDGGARLT